MAIFKRWVMLRSRGALRRPGAGGAGGSIVGMIIVPLSTSPLDLLISVNIAAAVTLLLVANYVSAAIRSRPSRPSA
jgi:hypothetical protein